MEQGGGAPLVVTALVTWFHPSAEALEALEDAVAECTSVVVVDNTPADRPSLGDVADLPPGVRLLRPGSNRGLAAALNLGVRHLPSDTEAVLLLDQDSRVPPGMVAALSSHLRSTGTGAAAPAPWDELEGRYLDPRTVLRPEVAQVTVAITSGLLVARQALEVVGPFREDFFVDAVDLDFCLRLRRAGWGLVQDRSVVLPHRLGETRWHRLLGCSIRASHHPDWRLYAGARNGTLLCRENVVSAPRWAVTQAALLVYWWLTVTCFEPPRRARSRLFLRGVVDGLRGAPARMGAPTTGPV